MQPDLMPTWQRLLAAMVILLGVVLADPIGHALARPTNTGGPAAPVAVPVLIAILLFVALGMALIGPVVAHAPRPLGWPEWLAAVLGGLTFALTGIAMFWLGANGPELRPALGIAIVHAAAWWYVLQWRQASVRPGLT